MTSSRPESYEWKLRARTPLWTGNVDRKNERLITTGLLGSIRWWCEVLVRGLGGSACDPTDDDESKRCPAAGVSAGDARHHCVVCELFGCTDWARKFRFDVLSESCTPQLEPIRANDVFYLRFTPMRSVQDQEWALIDLTLRLIADYGAIGGKTTLKPPGPDYGLVTLEERPSLKRVPGTQVKEYVSQPDWRLRQAPMWASLANFWSVKHCLEGGAFNRVLSGARARPGDNREKAFSEWLRGKQGESKKIFSFKNPARTFGFINAAIAGSSSEEILGRLRSAWRDLHGDEFVIGPTILDRLLQSP